MTAEPTPKTDAAFESCPVFQMETVSREYAESLVKIGDHARALECELAQAVREREGLREKADLAIWRLVQLTCACPYDPGKEGEGAQLMGPICDRCAAIHLLTGGELPAALAHTGET